MTLSGFAPHDLSGEAGGVEGDGGPPAPNDLSGENAISPHRPHKNGVAPKLGYTRAPQSERPVGPRMYNVAPTPSLAEPSSIVHGTPP